MIELQHLCYDVEQDGELKHILKDKLRRDKPEQIAEKLQRKQDHNTENELSRAAIAQKIKGIIDKHRHKNDIKNVKDSYRLYKADKISAEFFYKVVYRAHASVPFPKPKAASRQSE